MKRFLKATWKGIRSVFSFLGFLFQTVGEFFSALF